MAKRNSKRSSNSSMPTHPVLKGTRWTKALIDKIDGRWVLVGWTDGPADSGIAFRGEGEEPMFWNAKTDGMIELDSPGQIIDIAFKADRNNPYHVAKDGSWMVY